MITKKRLKTLFKQQNYNKATPFIELLKLKA